MGASSHDPVCSSRMALRGPRLWRNHAEAGGSMVTRISPDRGDFSIVIEKMSSSSSACARGSNPSSQAYDETVHVKFGGSFLLALQKGGRKLAIWRSNFTSGNSEGVNLPDEQLFQRMPQSLAVDADGRAFIDVHADEVVTLTTLTTGGKESLARLGAARSRSRMIRSLMTNESSPPRYWYDQMGAWEIQSEKTGSNNKMMRQVSPVWPACWVIPAPALQPILALRLTAPRG